MAEDMVLLATPLTVTGFPFGPGSCAGVDASSVFCVYRLISGSITSTGTVTGEPAALLRYPSWAMTSPVFPSMVLPRTTRLLPTAYTLVGTNTWPAGVLLWMNLLTSRSLSRAAWISGLAIASAIRNPAAAFVGSPMAAICPWYLLTCPCQESRMAMSPGSGSVPPAAAMSIRYWALARCATASSCWVLTAVYWSVNNFSRFDSRSCASAAALAGPSSESFIRPRILSLASSAFRSAAALL